MKPIVSVLIVMLMCGIPVFADEKPDQAKIAELATKAGVVLRRNCLQCHRGDGSASKAKFDVRHPETMIDTGVVVAGDSENSLLWMLAHRGTMPPRSQPQLPRMISADTKLIAEWIDAGAPKFPAPKARKTITIRSSLEAIQKHVKSLRDPLVRSRQRYFSFVEMHNNPEISEETLNLARAGLSKALNSLSWEREIVVPQPLEGTENTVMVVDLRDFGLENEQWKAIRSQYPYGLGFENFSDSIVSDLDQEISGYINQEPLYLVRGDWFIATATRPPLYHTVLYDLYLPELKSRLEDASQPLNPKRMTAGDLEKFLGVDVISDIEQGESKAARCGFTPSGVSEQNRLLERHPTRFGAYWKSYDFKADNRRAILAQFPLGPVFPGNKFLKQAFDHDGGEIIFNLPNGLQAYLLVNGKDGRIDAGPIEVVSDALKTSGSPAIVNGVSCFACHKEGMIDPPADEIREFSLLFGEPREQVRRLYPPKDAFTIKIKTDAEQFQSALKRATSTFLQIGNDKDRDLSEFTEPVSELARAYTLEELDLQAVAAELHAVTADGLDVNRLKERIKNDERLKQLGLGILLRPDGKIKRAFWEGLRGGSSVMQITAFSMDYSIRQFSK